MFKLFFVISLIISISTTAFSTDRYQESRDIQNSLYPIPQRPDAIEILNEITSVNCTHREEIEVVESRLNDLNDKIERTKYNIYIANLNDLPYLGE